LSALSRPGRPDGLFAGQIFRILAFLKVCWPVKFHLAFFEVLAYNLAFLKFKKKASKIIGFTTFLLHFV